MTKAGSSSPGVWTLPWKKRVRKDATTGEVVTPRTLERRKQRRVARAKADAAVRAKAGTDRDNVVEEARGKKKRVVGASPAAKKWKSTRPTKTKPLPKPDDLSPTDSEESYKLDSKNDDDEDDDDDVEDVVDELTSDEDGEKELPADDADDLELVDDEDESIDSCVETIRKASEVARKVGAKAYASLKKQAEAEEEHHDASKHRAQKGKEYPLDDATPKADDLPIMASKHVMTRIIQFVKKPVIPSNQVHKQSKNAPQGF